MSHSIQTSCLRQMVTQKMQFLKYCVQAMSTCVTLVLTLIPFTATAAPTLIDIKGMQK
jgi:hypothetical protein